MSESSETLPHSKAADRNRPPHTVCTCVNVNVCECILLVSLNKDRHADDCNQAELILLFTFVCRILSLLSSYAVIVCCYEFTRFVFSAAIPQIIGNLVSKIKQFKAVLVVIVVCMHFKKTTQELIILHFFYPACTITKKTNTLLMHFKI